MAKKLHLLFVIFLATFLAKVALAQCPQNVSLGGNLNLCGPDTTLLSPVYSGNTGAPTAINWYFNGNLLNNNANQLSVPSNAPGTYVVEASFGLCTVLDTIVVSATNLTLSLPFVSQSGVYYNPIDVNGIQTYPLCSGLGTTSILIENAAFQNNLNPPGTTFTLSYAGGPANAYVDSAAQTANLGNNYFILTAQNNGCTITQTFNIYSGSNPFVSLGALNSVGICPGNPVTFVIDPTLAPGIYNPPGTTYSLTFNDDTTAVLTYTNLTNDQLVYYIFGTTSCGITYPTGSNFPNNTFYAQVTAQNACGQTFSTVSPITVNSLPTPGFTVSDTTICAGTQVSVTNTGVSGNIVSTSAPHNCTGQAKFYWLLAGGTLGVDYTLNSGVLGSYNGNFNSLAGNGSQNLAITYNTPGNYTISQVQYNSCGLDTMIQHICVITAPTCNFSVAPANGCSPLSAVITNLSVAPTCQNSPIPLAYSWSLTSPSGASGNLSSNNATAPSLNLINTSNTNQTFIVNLTVSPLDPATNAPFGSPNCSATCQQTITVFPELQVQTPPNSTICNGSTLNIPLTANVPANLSWQANSNPNVSGETTTNQSNSLINDNLVNLSGSNQVVNYVLNGTSLTGACPDQSNFSVTVLPTHTLNAIADQSICAGAIFPGQIFTSSFSGITYTWTNNNPSIGLPATGTGPIPSFTAVNTGLTSNIAQLIVTPQFGLCIGQADTFLINVLPLPAVNTIQSQSLCPGQNTAAFNWQANIPGSTFAWTNNNTSIGLASNGSGNIGAFTALNSSLSTQTAQISINATVAGCTGPTQVVSITVYPTPQIQAPSNQVLCSGANTSTVIFSGQPTGNTFNWQNNNPAIGLAASGSGNIASFTATNTSNIPDTAVLSFTATNNSCISNSITFEIIVLPLPTLGLPANDTLCHAESYPGVLFSNPNNVANTFYIWTNDNPSIGLPSNGAGQGLPGFTSNNLGSNLIFATISVQASAAGCLSTPSSFQIGVNPNPLVLPQGPFYYCNGSQSQSIVPQSNVSGASFNWSLDLATIGLNQTQGTGSIPGFTVLNTSAQPITGNFNFTATYSSCVGPSQTISLVVNPTPVINPIQDIVVCALTNIDEQFSSNTPNIGTSYNWTNSEPNIGLAATGSGNLFFTALNPTNSALVSSINVTPTFTNGSVSCIGASTAFEITVQPGLVVSPIQDQTICAGSNSQSVVFSCNIAGSTFVWTNDNSAIGLSASGNGNLPTFIGLNNTNQTEAGQIAVVPTYTFGNQTCTGLPLDFLIQVLPLPTIDPTADLLFCTNNNVLVNFSSPFNAVTFNWSSPANSIGAPLNGQGDIQFSTLNPGNTPLSTSYIVQASTSLNNLVCVGPADTFDITVLPQVITNGSANQLLCSGDQTNAVTWTSNSSSVTYSWYSTTPIVGLPSNGLGNIAATTVSNLNSNQTVSTQLIGLATYSQNGLNCPGIPDTVEIAVQPIPLVNFTPGDQEICSGTNSQVVNLASNVSGAQITWNLINTSSGISGWNAPSGSSSIPSELLSNNLNSTGILQFSATANTTGALVCYGPPANYTISVLPVPQMTPVNDTALCAQINVGTIAFNGTATNFSWTSSNATIGLPINGSGNLTPFISQNTQSQVQTSELIVIPEFIGLNYTCFGAADTFLIHVLPLPNVTVPSNLTLCNGSTSTAITLNGTATSISWSNATTSIGLGSGGLDTIPSFTASNSSGTVLASLISLQPSYTAYGLTCQAPNTDFEIFVLPTSSIDTLNNQYLCHQGGSTGINFSGTANLWNWTNNNPTIGLPPNGVGMLPAFTAQNNTPFPDTAIISISSFYQLNGLNCPGEIDSFLIVVAPQTTVIVPPNQSWCNGTNTPVLNFSGNASFYQWSNNNPTIGLIGLGQDSIPGFTASNPGVSNNTATITVTPNYAIGGLNCPGISGTFTLSVVPGPTINAQQDLYYCTNTNIPALPLNGTASNYLWTNNNSNIGLVSNGSGTSLPAFTSINTSNTIQVAELIVTPVIDTGATTCIGLPQTFHFNILPVPDIQAIGNQELCSGSTTAPVVFSGNVANTQYNWQHNGTNISLPTNGVGNIAGLSLTNFGASPQVINFNVVPQVNAPNLSCFGDTITFDWNLLPQPIINNLGPLVYCNNTPVASFGFSGIANQYNWVNNNTSVGVGASGLDSIGAFTAVNNLSTPNEALITVTPFYQTILNTCVGTPIDLELVVNPNAQVTPIQDEFNCHEATTLGTIINGTGSSYDWTNSNPSIGLSASGTGQIPSFTAYNPGNTAAVGQITIIPYFSYLGLNCPGDTSQFTITVQPQPYALVPNDTLICNGGSINYNLNSTISASYQWYASSNGNISGATTSPQTTNPLNQTLTNNSAVAQQVSYTVTPTSLAGCTGPDSSFVVTIQPNVQLSVPPGIELCSGSPVNAILSANVASNFSWFVTVDNPNVTGEAITASIGTYINDVLVNTTNVNQIVVYAITPLSVAGGCTGGVQTLSVLVKPPLELLNSDTIIICSGSAVGLDLIANTNVSFTWYADQNPLVNGESTGLVGSAQINDVLQNNSPTIQEVLYHVTGTAAVNGCSTPIFPIWVQVLPVPIINPSNDISLCHNSTQPGILFSGTNQNTVFNWTAIGDPIGLSNLSGQQNLGSFTATNTGNTVLQSNITIEPSITYNGVTCDGNSDDFSIFVLPEPNVINPGNLTFCAQEQNQQFDLTGGVPGTTFFWTNNNTSIGLGDNGNNTIPAFIAQSNGQLANLAQIIVTPSYSANNLTCTGAVQTFEITVNPLPIILTNGTSICAGDTVNLLLNASLPSDFTWIAIPQPDVYGETSNPVQNTGQITDILSQISSTVQSVQYVLNASAIATGCQAPSSTITVNVNPLPGLDFNYQNNTLCEQNPIIFENNSSGNNNYSWSFGDGSTSVLSDPTHTYVNSGNYMVTLSATDVITGCQQVDSLLLQIGGLPLAGFSLSDSIGCGNLDVFFLADSINNGWTYSWDFGNGQSFIQLGNATMNFNQIGCYDISLTVNGSNGCVNQQMLTDGVCVFANPVAAFEASDYILDSNNPLVQFTNNSLNAVDYSWDFGDGNTSFAIDPSHMYGAADGTYTVQLIATNEVNCSDTSSLTLSVYEDLSIYVPNTFTPNDDENNQEFKPILAAGFKPSNYRLLIFDRWGELVFESRDAQIGWDGHNGYGGEPCQDGTYTWKISVVVEASQEAKTFIGHVNLLR
jgi:gliding motility-associated-like protein